MPTVETVDPPVPSVWPSKGQIHPNRLLANPSCCFDEFVVMKHANMPWDYKPKDWLMASCAKY